MNIVIIEDERLVADDLEKNVKTILGESARFVQIRSVKEGIAYFQDGIEPDLVFSDIQLGDGLSFEIFTVLSKPVPVIFCTAYDEYALEAFRANGIDYILKPFTKQMLEDALNKFRQLKQMPFTEQIDQYQLLMKMLAGNKKQQAASVIVYQKDKIIPISLDDVALFYLEGETTRLLTFSGKTYYPNKPLDELERISGTHFFRANRQFLVSRKVIVDVSNFFSRKLALNISLAFKDKIIVSKAKAPLFLEWLTQTG